MYLQACGKSGLEIATNNTVAFATEIFSFAINISGGVANLRAAFTAKINKAIKNYLVSRH